jgi:glycerate-2-kinase
MIPDTPKQGAVFSKKTSNIIVGSIRQSIEAARVRAVELGFEPRLLTSELQGEAKDAARSLASEAKKIRSAMRPGDDPRCLLSGGETTVTVRGKGRWQEPELALAFALEIEGRDGISLLSAGTDGTDGPRTRPAQSSTGQRRVKPGNWASVRKLIWRTTILIRFSAGSTNSRENDIISRPAPRERT